MPTPALLSKITACALVAFGASAPLAQADVSHYEMLNDTALANVCFVTTHLMAPVYFREARVHEQLATPAVEVAIAVRVWASKGHFSDSDEYLKLVKMVTNEDGTERVRDTRFCAKRAQKVFDSMERSIQERIFRESDELVKRLRKEADAAASESPPAPK